LNPATAEWCGQCLEPRAKQRSEPPDPPAAIARPQAVSGENRLTQTQTVAAGAMTVEEGEVMWRCAICDTENPLASEVCEACGSSFGMTMQQDVIERPQRDPNKVALYSLFCPGAGHAYLGEWGQAIARFVLSAWVIGVALLAALQGHTGLSFVTAAVFGLIALALWMVAAHDAYREAMHQQGAVILKGRMIVYLVMGLLMLMMVLLVFGTLAANSG
jgi:hypothetical protein